MNNVVSSSYCLAGDRSAETKTQLTSDDGEFVCGSTVGRRTGRPPGKPNRTWTTTFRSRWWWKTAAAAANEQSDRAVRGTAAVCYCWLTLRLNLAHWQQLQLLACCDWPMHYAHGTPHTGYRVNELPRDNRYQSVLLASFGQLLLFLSPRFPCHTGVHVHRRFIIRNNFGYCLRTFRLNKIKYIIFFVQLN